MSTLVIVRRALAAVSASLALAVSAAQTPPWPDAPFTYFANNVSLPELLAEFASGFSLAADLPPGLEGRVNGRFSTRQPGEFLTRLGAMYGFSWYVQSGVLHVDRAANQQVRALPLPLGVGPVRQILLDLGVVDARFGWSEMPSQNLVLVSGPPGYINQVETAIRQLPTVSSTQQVRVFRLRYASADDRVMRQGDRSIVQPGMARVLRELVLGSERLQGPLLENKAEPVSARGGASAGAGVQGPDALPTLPMAPRVGEAAGSAGTPEGGAAPNSPSSAGLSSAGSRSERSERPPVGSGGRSAAGAPDPGPPTAAPASPVQVGGDPLVRRPSIQTDPRLNALIIQDQPERMPLYERLIAQLDVPTPLIEIEAMIIDVNSERIRELGVNWALSSGGVSVGFGPTSSQPGQGTFGLALSSGGSTLSAAAGSQLLAQVRVLETQGDARIQSRPSVLTLDNLGALLDLSETFYVRVMGERFAGVSPVTAGTSLRVTPRLIDGEQASIQLAIDIEDGQIQDRQIDTLPTVRRSTVSTQAIVRHSESLLIAGYSTDQSINAVQKVPMLGDLPVVGALFSTRSVTSQKRERLFLIRPKLVGLGVAPPVAVPPSEPPRGLKW